MVDRGETKVVWVVDPPKTRLGTVTPPPEGTKPPVPPPVVGGACCCCVVIPPVSVVPVVPVSSAVAFQLKLTVATAPCSVFPAVWGSVTVKSYVCASLCAKAEPREIGAPEAKPVSEPS